MKLVLLLIIALTGCDKFAPLRQTVTIDPALQPYFDKFTAYAKQANKQTHITSLVFEPSNYAGVCIIQGTNRTAKINPKEWQDLDSWRREALVFHELGHCALGRGHLDLHIEVPGGFLPVSIMRKQLIDSGDYQNSYDYYIAELFSITGSL